ncbi:MAG: hypothetical protein KC729_15800, partial [Candidatus Eisenbacteria bacterium]|nr:hypothetical protein [Candidatus Eisenbacteria bacterium]
LLGSINPRSHESVRSRGWRARGDSGRPRLHLFPPLLWAGLCAGLFGCGDEHADPPEPHRVPLGVAVDPRGAPATDPLLVEAYSDLSQGAFPLASLQLDWGETESQLAHYDWTFLDNHVRQAEEYDLGLSVAVVLIENQARGTLPVDLRGQWIESVNLQVRFTRFARALLERAGGRVRYLWVGRETDVYLAQHPDQENDFRSLLRACRDSLAISDPGVGVGTTFAYGEAVDGGWFEALRPILELGDPIGLSVYGRDRDYHQVLGPDETLDLVRDAIAQFPGRRVVVAETGYPRATPDDADQLAFARRLTGFLDDAPVDLECAFWSRLYDADATESIPQSQHVFSEDTDLAAAYRQQLESLGLRLATGAITPTWLAVANWSVTRDVPLPAASLTLRSRE